MYAPNASRIASTNPSALGRRVEELPHVVELEQRAEQIAVPDQRIERREERDRRRWLRRRFEQSDLVAEDEALAAHALDLDGNEVAVLDELLAERGSARMPRPPRVGLRGAEAAEDVSSAADAEQGVRAVARVELVAQLFWQRDISPKQLRREQSLEEVVVPTVAVASREAEHAREGVRLEQRAHGVRRHPEPVGRTPALALEIARRQRSLRPDPLEHPLGHLGVLGDHARMSRSQRRAEPGELARENEGESLVVRLEDLAPLVELVAPRGVVAGDARVEHEIVRAAGDIDRVELDRPEPAEHLEHAVAAPFERARRREQVARDEEAAGGLGRDFHRRE